MSIFVIGNDENGRITYDVRDILEEVKQYLTHAETILGDKRDHSLADLRDARGYVGRAEGLILMLPLSLPAYWEEQRFLLKERAIDLLGRLNAASTSSRVKVDIPLTSLRLT